MPTYDYECAACGGKFEIFHSMSEAARKKCPACGKRSLKRLPGAGAGFLFRGSGFYITDYRSEDYKAKAKAETDSGKAASGEGKAPAATGAAGESKAKKGGSDGKKGGPAKAETKAS